MREAEECSMEIMGQSLAFRVGGQAPLPAEPSQGPGTQNF